MPQTGLPDLPLANHALIFPVILPSKTLYEWHHIELCVVVPVFNPNLQKFEAEKARVQVQP